MSMRQDQHVQTTVLSQSINSTSFEEHEDLLACLQIQ